MLYTAEPTELLYMTNRSFEFSGSEVVDTFKNESGKTVLILDKTIFYPQGGGQSFDIGEIYTQSSVFSVEEVRFVDGLVHHIGTYKNGDIKAGDIVNLKIDPERKTLNSKLQSAGHLIDIALRNAGFKEIIPLKGYHFPDGPYVEYVGEINGENIAEKLQEELNKMINTGYEVVTKLSTLEEAKSCCYFFPPHIPEGKPVRIVAVWNNEFIPCGGTHVSNITELRGLKVKEVKQKKGNTRVSYSIE